MAEISFSLVLVIEIVSSGNPRIEFPISAEAAIPQSPSKTEREAETASWMEAGETLSDEDAGALTVLVISLLGGNPIISSMAAIKTMHLATAKTTASASKGPSHIHLQTGDGLGDPASRAG